MVKVKSHGWLLMVPLYPGNVSASTCVEPCNGQVWTQPTTRDTVLESVLLPQQLTGARVIPKYSPWVDGSLSHFGATSVLPCSRLIYPNVIVFGVASGSSYS